MDRVTLEKDGHQVTTGVPAEITRLKARGYKVASKVRRTSSAPAPKPATADKA